MKTLILYATKYGATFEIAQQIANKINDSVVYDLKQKDIPSLAKYDCIMIGSSIYVGIIRKEAKTFLSQNTDVLHGKKLGLFLSGMDASKEKAYFDTNFSQDILQAASAMNFLGGIFDPKKAGTIDRFIIKKVSKQSGYLNNILNDKIEQFTEVMKV